MATDHIQAIIGPLKEQRAVLQTELEALNRQRKELGEELVRIDKVLRAAGDKPAPKEKAAKNGGKQAAKKKKGGKPTVSAWRTEAVKGVLESVDAPLSVTQIAEKLGWNRATTDLAINQAKDSGKVRLMGATGGTNSARLYGSTDKVYATAEASSTSNGDHPGS